MLVVGRIESKNGWQTWLRLCKADWKGILGADVRHFEYTTAMFTDINSLQNLAGVPFMVSHIDRGTFGCEDHAPFQLIMSGV